jgi:peptide/nickel transport system substrate-binding protein
MLIFTMKKILILIALSSAVYWGWNTHSTSNHPSTLKISGPFEFHGIDIAKDGSVFSRLGVTQSLTHLNLNGEIEPWLAARWNESPDGKHWELTLRNNVRFHDGQALSAHDVEQSLKRAMNHPGVMKNVPIINIQAKDNRLLIDLSSPYRPLLNALAHYSTGILSADSITPDGEIIKLNATGPFKLKSMIAPHKLTLEKFDDYWSDPASISIIEYQAGHRAESRTLQLQSGQIDIAYSIDAINKSSLTSSASVVVKSINLPRTILLKLNNEHPYLRPLETRQAMSLTLDRIGIANRILFTPGSEADQLFAPAQAAWHLNSFTEPRNLTQAQALLEQVGWVKNAQGWLEKDGKRFSLNLTTYADRPELPLIATAIQSQLADVGIDVHVSIDNSSHIPATHHDNTLELALLARNFGMTGTPLPLLYDDFNQKKGSDWGHMNWSSSAMNADINRLIVESNPEQQRDYSQKIAARFAQERPVIPVAYSSQHVAVTSSLKGLIIDPFELDYRLEKVSFNE